MIMQFTREVLNMAESICQRIQGSIGWPTHIDNWHGKVFPQDTSVTGKLDKSVFYRVLAKYGLLPYALEMGCNAATNDGLSTIAKEAVFNEFFFLQVRKRTDAI